MMHGQYVYDFLIFLEMVLDTSILLHSELKSELV